MFRTVPAVIAVALILTSASAASAASLTFEDVPGGSAPQNVGNMPTYQGFNFSFTLDWIDAGHPCCWPYGAHSGSFAILNNNGGVGVITAADASDFWFGGLWAKTWGTAPNSGGPDQIFGTIAGWNNGALVWSMATALNGTYEFIGPQTAMIDELRLGFGNHFLADDISLNEFGDGPNTAPVPEPASILLLGSGLAGVAARRLRARRQKA